MKNWHLTSVYDLFERAQEVHGVICQKSISIVDWANLFYYRLNVSCSYITLEKIHLTFYGIPNHIVIIHLKSWKPSIFSQFGSKYTRIFSYKPKYIKRMYLIITTFKVIKILNQLEIVDQYLIQGVIVKKSNFNQKT